MKKKTAILPRHTILANTSARFVAFIVDVAIFFATFLILFFALFNPIFTYTTTSKLHATLDEFQIASHLVYYDEESDSTKIYNSDNDYTIYENQTRYFYLSYLTGNGINKDDAAPNYNELMESEDGTKMLPKDYYTVEWYNYNVLGITRDDPDADTSSLYFTYQIVDGEYDKSLIGVPRSHRYSVDKGQIDITNVDLVTYFVKSYEQAFRHLTAQKFYMDVYNLFTFYTGLSASIPILISGIINYLIIPLFTKNLATLGKLIMKLGLANNKGLKAKKSQLIMRFLPFFVVNITLGALYFIPIVTMAIIIIIILLISFALMMASPKHSSLHDFTAQTIVIDSKGSILFKDENEELEYLEKEDNIINDMKIEEDLNGEEPEISYEK